MLRFNGLMDGAAGTGTGLGIGVLSELDGGWVGDLVSGGAGGSTHSGRSDAGEEEDGEEVTPWVSEACVKAVVLGLLGMLAKEEDLESVKVRLRIYTKLSPKTDLSATARPSSSERTPGGRDQQPQQSLVHPRFSPRYTRQTRST